MPPFKDEAHLIVLPGSLRTLIRFGLEDIITPPTYAIPTKVYKNPEDPTLYLATRPSGVPDPESYAIRPIVRGEIVDIDAFNFLLKSIVKSVLKDNPLVLLDSITFTLVESSARWSPVDIERITNYAFETLQLAAVAIVPSALCSLFAYGSFSSACVVDVGFQKSEVTPIVDFQVYSPGVACLDEGGETINQTLAKLLPSLNAGQIESLKLSSIFEQLSAAQAKASFFGLAGLLDESKPKDSEKEEGVLDIAAIVTSDRSTREILEEKEREKHGNKKQKASGPVKANAQLETNTFVDGSGHRITVGKERFQGCNDLISHLADAVHRALAKVPDVKRRQECYDNLVICGKTSAIKGFKEELILQLYSRYVSGTSVGQLEKQKRAEEQQMSSFRNEASGFMDEISLVQAPKRVKVVAKPEYFSAWKKVGLEDCAFLGGEILCKQIFGGSGNSELYLSKEEYYEKGPMGIWHAKL